MSSPVPQAHDHSRIGGLCALQPLRYSLGHGIAIAPCAPMARVHPALQPRGPRGSILRHALPAQLCLPNLWRPGCDLGARTPHRLARQDRRITHCGTSFRRLANEAVITMDGPHPTVTLGANGTTRCRSLNRRATSVPFTAVLAGPERTTTDSTLAPSTCAVP